MLPVPSSADMKPPLFFWELRKNKAPLSRPREKSMTKSHWTTSVNA